MLGIDQHNLEISFQDVKNGFPIHASHNVTKNVIDWEYTEEILRIHLRLTTGDQLQASPHSTQLSHEGFLPQGPGVSYAQVITPNPQEAGGQSDV